MKHNVFQFGNTFYRQKDGIAIGAPPACDRAIQMFGFFEMVVIGPLFQDFMLADHSFIDYKIRIFTDDGS